MKTANALLKTLEDKNKFLASSQAERRVLIAQDVIRAINASIINARTGRYVNITSVDSPSEQDLCEFIHAKIDEDEECRCCAIGSMLLSRIGYQHPKEESCDANSLIKTDFPQDINCDERSIAVLVLENEFSDEQLSLMENTFERSSTLNGYVIGYEDAQASHSYGWSLSKNPNRRLTLIMENVIENNGTFVIPNEFYENEDDEE